MWIERRVGVTGAGQTLQTTGQSGDEMPAQKPGGTGHERHLGFRGVGNLGRDRRGCRHDSPFGRGQGRFTRVGAPFDTRA